ncbi:putative oxidoreductase YdhV [subsurface metagenome]
MNGQYGGYIGKILYVDLSNHKFREETPDDKFYADYIGGYGIGARILYSRQKAKVDPLGPDNMLGFVTGPLTGTPALTGTRFTLVGKSPLTGTWGDSNSGGRFGTILKSAGYDAVFFSGISDRPVYLLINDGKAELRDADWLWGKDIVETEKLLRAELGKEASIACIGRAGENLCLISGVVNDEGRIAARSGLGAVMGSKKLKAVAVIGHGKIPVKDPNRANQLRKKHWDMLQGRHIPDVLRKYGTCGFTPGAIKKADAAIKNWAGVSEVDYPDLDLLTGDSITHYQVRKHGCLRCPIYCGGIVKVENGPYQVDECGKPEYETLAVFGPMCLNASAESIIKLNAMCNDYGLDTLSVGGTLAFAIECYENGLIAKDDLGGIELTWGNSDAMIAVLDMMANREGFGDILADGSRVAARKIGKGAEKYAMQVQGQELPMHGMRNAPGYATSYSMDATPGRHTQGGFAYVERFTGQITGLDFPEHDRYDYSGKGEWSAKLHNLFHILNSAGICMLGYLTIDFNSIPDFMNAIVGREYTLDDLVKIGERIGNLRQSFNIREGLNPREFKLPDRAIGKPPLERGPVASVTVDVETQVREYLEAMDWDINTAKPSKRKLLELGLDDVAKELYQ